MTRAIMAFDRVVVLLLALVLVVGGGVTALWGMRQGLALIAPLDLTVLRDQLDEGWWPWAVGGASLLLTALGLRWLMAHLPGGGGTRIPLPGTGRSGRLLVDAQPVAEAAAARLAGTLGVQRVRGRVQHDRGSLTLRLNALLDPDADLRLVITTADEVSGEVGHLLGRNDVACLVFLRVAPRVAPRRRVN